jgi:starch synthase
MRVLIIGLFAPDYMIAIANAVAPYCQVTLMLTRQNIAGFFPNDPDPISNLKKLDILEPSASLQLIDYPKGRYVQKVKLINNLRREIRSFRPDILHYQSGGDPWLPLALPFLRSFPLVVTIHDAAHHPGDKPPKIVLTLKNALLTRLADQIIVHGQQQAEVLHHHYHTPLRKINAIYLGPFEIFKKLSRDQIHSDKKTILFFGRISPYKGIETLIKAAPLILSDVPDARIVIAGAGDCPSIQEAANANPATFEIHNRFINVDEVGRFFLGATLVVLPYQDATQSGIIPIAYMFNRPVVATRVGSIPEVVDNGKTGLLVEAGDERALADAVVRLLLDPNLCESMGKAAAIKLEQDLSWQSIARKTLQVYENARNITD